MVHERAGERAGAGDLIDVPALISAYFTLQPDPRARGERVAFGTSGHRGSALKASFNEAHLLAVAQAVCDHRRAQGIDGPLFVGKDTHALSTPAWISVVEVLVAVPLGLVSVALIGRRLRRLGKSRAPTTEGQDLP